MLSDQYEIAVLRELRQPYHGAWQAPSQIAEATELPRPTVLAALKSLRRRGLVDWTLGQYSITETGIAELCAAGTLRVIR